MADLPGITIKHARCNCPTSRGKRQHLSSCLHGLAEPDAKGRRKRKCRCPYRWSAEVTIRGERHQLSGSGQRTAKETSDARTAALEEVRKPTVLARRGTVREGITPWIISREQTGALRT